MAAQNPFLANWLKGVYGMELGLAPMLEQQASRLDDDTELHKSLALHLEKTNHHAALLRERLQRMGEDVSSMRPIDPVTSTIGHPSGGKPDTSRQTELLDYVTESFEVASYRGLQSLAEMLGDQETSRVCEQILADELMMSDTLSRRLPVNNGYNGQQAIQAAAAQGHAAQAREVFAALNAHDLNHFDKLVAKDYRAELPGDTRLAGWTENRAWLESFFTAFPDLHYELERLASSGDSAFVEWNATGTHAGPFRLMHGRSIPPTNKRIKFGGVTIFRAKNDKLIHTRIITDTAHLVRQLEAASARVAGREIVHLEIPAMDRRTTARFYGELFGWEYEHMDGTMNYTTFTTGTVPGGFPEVSEMNPAGEVIFYVYSDDIESDLRRAEKLGGRTLVERTEIPGYGYFAILFDPSGNRFGLYHVDQPA